ncbi:hypothetical protein D3C71_807560 [compost metagenome]
MPVFAPAIPVAGGFGRCECGRKHRCSLFQIAVNGANLIHVIAQDAELLQQHIKPVLRMGAARRIGGVLGNRLPLFLRHGEVEAGKHNGALRQGGNGGDQIGCRRNGARRPCDDDGSRIRQIGKPVRFRPQDGVAMPAGGGTVEFGKPRRPEDAGDPQEVRSQLPPLSVIASIEMLKRFPVLFFRIHRIDHLAKRTRQPYGIGGAGGGDKRRIGMDGPDGVRQAVAPGENETRQFDEPAGAGNRRRQIHDLRVFDLEEAAIVIRLTQRPDQRQNGGSAA